METHLHAFPHGPGYALLPSEREHLLLPGLLPQTLYSQSAPLLLT